MKIITWNINRANKDKLVWDLILEFNPDIALLQEVGGIPDKIKKVFQIRSKNAVNKKGELQKVSTAILAKGKIIKEIKLSSEYKWVNKEMKFFSGNFIGHVVQLPNQKPLKVVSVYSPAWSVDKKRLKGIDVSSVKLKTNPDVWGTEIIWSALKNTISNNETWIVGGDYNASETFDKEWQDKYCIKGGYRSSGNREILNRMKELGFTECLRKYKKKIIPTFQIRKNKQIIHQIDHLFVTNNLYPKLERCKVGNRSIFKNFLSDHLPIIAEFNK